MNFGQALEAAKKGGRITRRGWNGRNMFVVYMEGIDLLPHNSKDKPSVNHNVAKHIGYDTPIRVHPYMAMYNAQGGWIVGWSATQSDMLSDDWEAIDG